MHLLFVTDVDGEVATSDNLWVAAGLPESVQRVHQLFGWERGREGGRESEGEREGRRERRKKGGRKGADGGKKEEGNITVLSSTST